MTHTTISEQMSKTADIIKKATVYVQCLPDDSRTYRTRFYGLDADLVHKRAQKEVENIRSRDYMASPSASGMHFDGMRYEVIVKYYSVE